MTATAALFLWLVAAASAVDPGGQARSTSADAVLTTGGPRGLTETTTSPETGKGAGAAYAGGKR
jgi:hypothetical protein